MLGSAPLGPGLYARVLLLCETVTERDDGLTDVGGIRDHWGVPSNERSAEIEIGAFAAIERNGDKEKHELRFRFVDPEGAQLATSPIIESPPVDGHDSFFVTMGLSPRLETWLPGVYRLLLEIDGQLAAAAPLELYVTEPVAEVSGAKLD